jgi:DNA-binding NtrC family response regulator
LEFVEKTLEKEPPEGFEFVTIVRTAANFDTIISANAKEPYFDLVLIGLGCIQENIKIITGLSRTSKWHFVALFPGFPDGQTARLLFKMGMRDLLSKPYDVDSLWEMVKEQIEYADEYQRKKRKELSTEDYRIRVNQLNESLKTTNKN